MHKNILEIGKWRCRHEEVNFSQINDSSLTLKPTVMVWYFPVFRFHLFWKKCFLFIRIWGVPAGTTPVPVPRRRVPADVIPVPASGILATTTPVLASGVPGFFGSSFKT